MGKLAQLALRQVHTGKTQRAFDLIIGGVSYADQVRTLSVEFDALGGGSGLSINVRDSLEGLDDAPATLRVGYGETMTNYFVGTLQEPQNYETGQGVAYGPFKLMSDQSLGEYVRYQGVTVSFIFRDLARRAGYIGSLSNVIEVIQGEQVIPLLEYTEETKLSEVAQDVAEQANFVFFDRPGFKRTAMPAPKPGLVAQTKAFYYESNYPVDGFLTRETKPGAYSKVVVYRNGGAGETLVRHEVPIPNRSPFPPPANRIFYVSDYPGTAQQARQQAYELAQRLSHGSKDFELSNIWLNPELEPWDVISVERTERRSKRDASGKPQKRGKWLTTYQCYISDSIGVEISPELHHQSLSGTALKVTEIKLPDPIVLGKKRILPPGMLTARANILSKPNVGLKPQRGPFKPDVGLKPNVGLKPQRGPLKPDKRVFTFS